MNRAARFAFKIIPVGAGYMAETFYAVSAFHYCQAPDVANSAYTSGILWECSY